MEASSMGGGGGGGMGILSNGPMEKSYQTVFSFQYQYLVGMSIFWTTLILQ